MKADAHSAWRDSQGRRLVNYPRPSLAVDVALMTVTPHTGQLAALLVRRDEPLDGRHWALPGTFVHERERLAEAVLRLLRDKCDISGLAPRQLHVFDDPDRDPRGWVISVAHADTVPYHRISRQVEERSDLHLAPVAPPGGPRPPLPDGQAGLPADHEDILDRAVRDLRARYRNAADPDRLLNDHFTIRQLQQIHDAVDGRASHKDAFRRFADDKIEGTEDVDRSGPGRPAQLYRRRHPDADSRAAAARGAETAYSADELLAAVAEYARSADRVTIQGYASWARSTGRPSEALIRRRLAAELGGWSGIVRAATGAAGSRQHR
ncbi:NUDIX hydrolase [Micromonospora globispora]|uniref:NUDIX hydrolase n=1 Tax=Micromonospora globispora TaxID=1450148 RepID=UPI001A9C49C2|nr:NUDIX hydrolase [Micromonospora globispora]